MSTVPENGQASTEPVAQPPDAPPRKMPVFPKRRMVVEVSTPWKTRAEKEEEAADELRARRASTRTG